MRKAAAPPRYRHTDERHPPWGARAAVHSVFWGCERCPVPVSARWCAVVLPMQIRITLVNKIAPPFRFTRATLPSNCVRTDWFVAPGVMLNQSQTPDRGGEKVGLALRFASGAFVDSACCLSFIIFLLWRHFPTTPHTTPHRRTTRRADRGSVSHGPRGGPAWGDPAWLTPAWMYKQILSNRSNSPTELRYCVRHVTQHRAQRC